MKIWSIQILRFCCRASGRTSARRRRLGIPIGIGLLVAGAVLGWSSPGTPLDALSGHGAWARVLVLGIPALLIVWGTIQIHARKGVFTYLGDASYALYLIHPPICAGTIILLTRVAHVPADIAILAGMGANVVVAWRVHELFEKPALAILKRAMAT